MPHTGLPLPRKGRCPSGGAQQSPCVEEDWQDPGGHVLWGTAKRAGAFGPEQRRRGQGRKSHRLWRRRGTQDSPSIRARPLTWGRLALACQFSPAQSLSCRQQRAEEPAWTVAHVPSHCPLPPPPPPPHSRPFFQRKSWAVRSPLTPCSRVPVASLFPSPLWPGVGVGARGQYFPHPTPGTLVLPASFQLLSQGLALGPPRRTAGVLEPHPLAPEREDGSGGTQSPGT